jgi:aspartyl-tRNA(Asn)/glutamyl-tRNA(Gln) amidotransferase subunit C
MLSKEEVLKIAKLARLELNDSEVTLYQTRLGRVLEYIDELNKIAPKNLEFVEHIPKDAVSFRADEAKNSGLSEAILKNAPQIMDDCFLLPPIIEHE